MIASGLPISHLLLLCRIPSASPVSAVTSTPFILSLSLLTFPRPSPPVSTYSCQLLTPKFSIIGILYPRRSSSRSSQGLMLARACWFARLRRDTRRRSEGYRQHRVSTTCKGRGAFRHMIKKIDNRKRRHEYVPKSAERAGCARWPTDGIPE